MNKEGKVTLGLVGVLGGAMVLGSARAEMCNDYSESPEEAAAHAALLEDQSQTRSQIEAILEDGAEGINCEALSAQALASPGLRCETGEGEPFIVSFTEQEKNPQ